MNVCQLRLYNEMSVLVDVVDFLQEPFVSPLQLRIPKATKRIQERGENLFRDGSDIAGSRYNNAVITIQPRMVLNCVADEALKRIEQIRYRLDRILEYSRNTNIAGFGPRVEFWEDTKGFNLVSEIIDGTFDIEQDWEWSATEQGVITDSSLTLTRRPFRLSEKTQLLSNYVLNPGFESVTGSTIDKWTASGAGVNTFAPDTTHVIEGQRCAKLTTNVSASNAQVDSTTITTDGGIGNFRVYLEAWVHVPAGATSITLQLYNNDIYISGVVASVTWNASDIVQDPADERVFRWRHHNWYDVSTPGEFTDSKRFIRKAFKATIVSGYPYIVRFLVTAPGAAVSYYIDRVMLTVQEKVTSPATNAEVFDPTISGAAAGRMISGWVSDSDVMNHMDDGATDHGTGGTTYHHNYLDIVDIPGDVPAICDIKIRNLNGTNLKTIRVGCNSLNDPFVPAYQQETGATADSSASQNNRQTTSISGGWAGISGGYVNPGNPDINSRTFNGGKYRIVGRIKDTAAAQGNLRLRYNFLPMAGSPSIDGPEVVAPSAGSGNWSVVDLGGVFVPFVFNSDVLDRGARLETTMQAKRTTGTNDVYADYILMMPVNDWYAAVSAGAWNDSSNDIDSVHISSLPGIPANCYVSNLFVGGTNIKFAEEFVSSQRIIEIPSQVSGVPFLRNNKAIRMFLSFSRASDIDLVYDKVRCVVWYRSRWL